MIQFNLLPDIKIQYLKARQQKRVVMLVAVLVVIASGTVIVLLSSFVFGIQKKTISDLDKDITTAASDIESTPELTTMLTVQNQLKVIPGLHDAKAVASRLFTYISQSTPASASIARLNADFVQHTMSISGAANSLETVNTYVDTLKFTTYYTDQDTKTLKPAFSDVVLSSFGRNSKEAAYTITLNFDPNIFSEQYAVTLTVPNITTTRSEISDPSALFQNTQTEQQ